MSPPRPRSTPARSGPDRKAQQRAGHDRPARARAAAGASADELRGLLEPVATAAGFELDALDVRSAGRRHTVRMVVDSDTGASLDDIARLSRAASDVLDSNEHLVGGSYTLEVTSPGVDRPLTLPRHWRRARLRLVTVRPQPGSPSGDAALGGRGGGGGGGSGPRRGGGGGGGGGAAARAPPGVEVEFAPPPAKEVALLDPGAGGGDAARDPGADAGHDVEEGSR